MRKQKTLQGIDLKTFIFKIAVTASIKILDL